MLDITFHSALFGSYSCRPQSPSTGSVAAPKMALPSHSRRAPSSRSGRGWLASGFLPGEDGLDLYDYFRPRGKGSLHRTSRPSTTIVVVSQHLLSETADADGGGEALPPPLLARARGHAPLPPAVAGECGRARLTSPFQAHTFSHAHTVARSRVCLSVCLALGEKRSEGQLQHFPSHLEEQLGTYSPVVMDPLAITLLSVITAGGKCA